MAGKILLISYHFPPSAEVGGLRIANFARRLPRFGWTPYVLTIEDRYLHTVDAGRLEGMVPARIFKAGRTPTVSQAYLACKKTVRRLLRQPDLASAKPNRAASAAPARSGEAMSRRLRRYVLSFLSLPDAERSWLLPALLEAVRVVRREKIDCILTSCPPYSTHLVGLLVKWISGVRWVADFRDPWMTAGSKSLYATCAASLGIERRLERTVVGNADLIVANTGRLCEALKTAYGSVSSDRFVCITNGFDSEYFSAFSQLPKEAVERRVSLRGRGEVGDRVQSDVEVPPVQAVVRVQPAEGVVFFNDAHALVVVGQPDSRGQPRHPRADDDDVVVHNRAAGFRLRGLT